MEACGLEVLFGDPKEQPKEPISVGGGGDGGGNNRCLSLFSATFSCDKTHRRMCTLQTIDTETEFCSPHERAIRQIWEMSPARGWSREGGEKAARIQRAECFQATTMPIKKIK